MDIRDFILMIVTAVNLLMSGALFARSKGSKINLSFAFVLFFTALWSISMYFFRSGETVNAIAHGFRATIVFGVALSISLAVFSFYFPFKHRATHVIEKIFLYGGFVVIAIVIYSPGFILTGNVISEWTDITFERMRYLFILVYLTYVFFEILLNLYQKLMASTGIHRIHIKTALIGIFAAIMVGSFFDLGLFYLGIYEYNWLGPLSTLVINMIIFYMIFLRVNRA